MSIVMLVATKGLTPEFTVERVTRYLSFDNSIDLTQLDGEIHTEDMDLDIEGIQTTAFRYFADKAITNNLVLVIAGDGVKELDARLLSPVVLKVMTLTGFVPGLHDYSLYIQKSFVVYVLRDVEFPDG